MKTIMFILSFLQLSTAAYSQAIIPRDVSNYWNYSIGFSPYQPFGAYPVFENIFISEGFMVTHVRYDSTGVVSQFQETWTENNDKLIIENVIQPDKVFYDRSLNHDTVYIGSGGLEVCSVFVYTKPVLGNTYNVQKWYRHSTINEYVYNDVFETADTFGVIYRENLYGFFGEGDFYEYNLESCCARDTVYGDISPYVYNIYKDTLYQGDEIKIKFIPKNKDFYRLALKSEIPPLYITIQDSITFTTGFLNWEVNTNQSLGNCRFVLTSMSDSSISGTSADSFQVCSQIQGVGKDEPPGLKFNLAQNYPNPFNPVTAINYSLPSPEKVTIKVYGILGKVIETLVDEEKLSGTYELTWNAANLPSGVYFYRIKAGGFIQTRKMILLK